MPNTTTHKEKMDFIVIFFLPLIFISLVHLINRCLSINGKPKLPPSPPKLPIIGNLHQMGAVPYLSIQALAAKHGPLMLLHFGSVPTVVVSSAEMAEQVLRTHEINFADRPLSLATDILFLQSCGIGFGPCGDTWRTAKKICVTELLSQKRVQEFKFVREEEISNMIDKLRSGGDPIDIGEMLTHVAYNIISRCALGGVHERSKGGIDLRTMAKTSQDFLTSFCFKDYFPYLGWADALTGFTGKVKRVSKELHEFLDQLIEEHLTQKTDHKLDLIHILLSFQLPRDNIIAILMDLLLAATDDISTTLEWGFAELVKHPSVMRKAQEEVRRVVGGRSRVEEEDLHKMEYLNLVIKETLRLRPSATVISRKSISDIKLGGYEIPAGTSLLIDLTAIHRDPKLWDDADEFIPERFQNSDLNKNIFSFGGGRRGCPGIAFSMAEIQSILANLLFWFDWKLPPGNQRWEDLDMEAHYQGLVVRKKTPLFLTPSLPEKTTK